MENALQRMTPEDRNVLVLWVCCGLSNADAAETLGLSTAATSKRLARAVVRLRAILAESR